MSDSEIKKLISIVIPVFNEEENIERCYKRLCAVIDQIDDYRFEFVFTDNHSKDRSFQLLEKLAQQDKRVMAYSFSKNFGYQRSIYTGLIKARGDAAIVFDCDLQDPPELISDFLQMWEQGNKVVYGVRKKRQESRIVEWTRKIFYRLIDLLSEDHLPLDSGDFRLIDRTILDILKSIPEQEPYLRGIIASLGYKQTGIPYARNKREAGVSKFNFRALCKMAIDGIISQSIVPLRISAYVGLIVALIAFMVMCGYLVGYLFFSVNWPEGFATIAILVLFSISINAIFFWIVGEYLARIYKQVRNRPLTLIERVTCTKDQEAAELASFTGHTVSEQYQDSKEPIHG